MWRCWRFDRQSQRYAIELLDESGSAAYHLQSILSQYQRDADALYKFLLQHEDEVAIIERSMLNGVAIETGRSQKVSSPTASANDQDQAGTGTNDEPLAAYHSEWLVVERKLRRKLQRHEQHIDQVRQAALPA